MTVAARSSRSRWTAVAGAVALTGLLGLYLWLVATRATALIRTGDDWLLHLTKVQPEG